MVKCCLRLLTVMNLRATTHHLRFEITHSVSVKHMASYLYINKLLS